MSVHPSVRLSIRPSVRTSPLGAIQPGLRPSQPDPRPSLLGLRPSQPDLRPSQPDLGASQPAKPQASGLAWPGWIAQRGEWTDRRMNRKSPHSTGLCPLSEPLPCFPPCKPRKCHFKLKVKQGNGTADHLMPLGYLLGLDLF